MYDILEYAPAFGIYKICSEYGKICKNIPYLVGGKPPPTWRENPPSPGFLVHADDKLTPVASGRMGQDERSDRVL